MHRIAIGAAALTVLGLFLDAQPCRAQKALPANGWGSLSGKVTLKGAVPPVVDLTALMAKHTDKACCLAGKPLELIDSTWLVGPKKEVANVVVWVKGAKGTYFPIHPNFQKRKDEVVIDQPHCAFLPRISAINPSYFDGKGEVATGQKVTIKNSAVVGHNVRAVGHPDFNPGFNKNMPAKTELDVSTSFKPQLFPISLNCDIHTWMAAKLFVFDHPYYAITKADGTYEIPFVPAGTDVSIMAWHEGKGWLMTKAGKAMNLNAGKNVLDIEFEAAAP